MDVFERARNSYKGREYLYLFPRSEHDYWAVNYYAICSELNSLLTLFSINGSRTGVSKLSEDGNHSEIWFKVSDDFYRIATENETFRGAIERLGVKIVTDYPFFKQDPWTHDWKAMAKAVNDYHTHWSPWSCEED